MNGSSRVIQRNPNWLRRLLAHYPGREVLAIGFPVGSEGASARYPDGTSLLMVAAVNNFGSLSGHVPRRAFMELGADMTHAQTAPLIRQLVPRINAMQLTAPQALNILGPVAVSQHQAAIVELTAPPNAPATVARKQSDNPLIDSGLLQQSVTFSVRQRG